MFIGHVGAGLALKKISPHTNVAWAVFGALFIDIVLWALVAVGIEEVTIPSNYDQLHFLRFGFPYSHSLIAVFFWSLFCLMLGRLISGNWGLGFIIGTACISHWILDVIVHPAQIVIADPESTQVGFGLWRDLPVAVGLETFILLVGLLIYWRSASNKLSKRIGLACFVLVLGVLSLAGQMLAPAPSSVAQIVVSSLLIIAITLVVIWMLDRTKTNPNLEEIKEPYLYK